MSTDFLIFIWDMMTTTIKSQNQPNIFFSLRFVDESKSVKEIKNVGYAWKSRHIWCAFLSSVLNLSTNRAIPSNWFLLIKLISCNKRHFSWITIYNGVQLNSTIQFDACIISSLIKIWKRIGILHSNINFFFSIFWEQCEWYTFDCCWSVNKFINDNFLSRWSELRRQFVDQVEISLSWCLMVFLIIFGWVDTKAMQRQFRR